MTRKWLAHQELKINGCNAANRQGRRGGRGELRSRVVPSGVPLKMKKEPHAGRQGASRVTNVEAINHDCTVRPPFLKGFIFFISFHFPRQVKPSSFSFYRRENKPGVVEPGSEFQITDLLSCVLGVLVSPLLEVKGEIKKQTEDPNLAWDPQMQSQLPGKCAGCTTHI